MSITSQVTMAWNGRTLIVEAANPTTGAREKLAVTLDQLPYELQVVLKDNLRKAQGHAERLREAATIKEQRYAELRAREAQAARESEDRWAQYLSSLAPHIVAWHEHKRSLRIAKSATTARELWEDIASTKGLGIPAANMAVVPERRPRRIEIHADGSRRTVYYPQTGETKTTRQVKRKTGVTTRFNTSDVTFDL